MNRPSIHHAGPRFKLGHILATPGALEVIADAHVSIVDLLIRHMRGDWGDLSDSDRQQNELAITAGQRILSNYVLPSGRTVLLITEADRFATTFLLPGEY
ncbi:Type I restriction-modification system methyltransferase subunit [Burkholderia pseudomallei]|nr:Type I restriction-modification system methyltransferase subunit [Burkholderia pseudomallei]CAJ8197152.1 Type I restriction-modification system methyltransferase subunit [Burkholderia pseudomallei]